MTIHNMAYQGRFWHWDMLLTGLDWKYFNWQQLEFHGDLNLLKAGIVFADSITTVSPTLRGRNSDGRLRLWPGRSVLAQRHDDLTGNPQRRRLRTVEPGHRPTSGGQPMT